MLANHRENIGAIPRRMRPVRLWADNGLLALLLVAAVLLCHGALGAAHQIGAGPAISPETAGAHASLVAGGEEAGGHSGGQGEAHPAHVNYAAILLLISVGVVLGLLLGRSRRWRRVAVLSLAGRRLPPVVPRCARGPTLPLLQVFRL